MNQVEDLLDEAAVRQALGGISQTTLWRSVKSGRLPKPITIGQRSKRWLSSEIVQAIADEVARRDRGVAA